MRPAPLLNTNHHVAQIASHQSVAMSDTGFRAPFGWQIAGLCPRASELRLTWPDVAASESKAILRIAVLDTREPLYRVEVRLGRNGRVVGEFEIRWAAHFQIYGVEVSATELAREGVVLRVIEAWFCASLRRGFARR